MTVTRPLAALAASLTLLGTLAIATPANAAHPAVASAAHEAVADVEAVRASTFCLSGSCVSKAAAEKKAAQAAVASLVHRVDAVKLSSLSGGVKAQFTIFANDVHLLADVMKVYYKQTNAALRSGNRGVLYYDTAQIASDAYDLNVLLSGKTPDFRNWSAGNAATLYVMQVDSQTLATKKISDSVIAFVASCIEAAATTLALHDNSPNATYNHQLAAFANLQATVSASEVRLVTTGKSTMSTAEIEADSRTLGQEFTSVTKLQFQLAKE
jgi:hypothetical protein